MGRACLEILFIHHHHSSQPSQITAFHYGALGLVCRSFVGAEVVRLRLVPSLFLAGWVVVVAVAVAGLVQVVGQVDSVQEVQEAQQEEQERRQDYQEELVPGPATCEHVPLPRL
jgi:predicted aspartyl protease